MQSTYAADVHFHTFSSLQFIGQPFVTHDVLYKIALKLDSRKLLSTHSYKYG